MTTHAVRTKQVTRSYGDLHALDGVDLEIEPGEVFAILGPNGAGKTTLVEILEGLRRRDGGSAAVLDVDPSDGDRTWRSRIGAVLQTSTQNEELTVREMTQAFASYYPNPLDVDELLESLDLVLQADQRIQQLSGGQRRRLDLALGMVGRPELLFLDEPTTGLDPEVRIRIWEFIEELAAGGMTIVLTTHYMEEAERLADRVAVLVAGEIITVGTPTSLGSAGQTLVSFRLAGDLPSLDLPSSIGPLVTRDDRFEIATENSTETVSALLAWAEAHDREIEDLAVEKRGLEEAYLDLLTTNAEEPTT